jgi:hypothetical protein
MYNKLIKINTRNVQILSFYLFALYNYEYYKNKGKSKIITASDNNKMNIEQKLGNLKK